MLYLQEQVVKSIIPTTKHQLNRYYKWFTENEYHRERKLVFLSTSVPQVLRKLYNSSREWGKGK